MINLAQNLKTKAQAAYAKNVETEYLNIMSDLQDAASNGKFSIIVAPMYKENIAKLKAEGFYVVISTISTTIYFDKY